MDTGSQNVPNTGYRGHRQPREVYHILDTGSQKCQKDDNTNYIELRILPRIGDHWTFLGLRRVIWLECMGDFGHGGAQKGHFVGVYWRCWTLWGSKKSFCWSVLEILDIFGEAKPLFENCMGCFNR